MARTLALLAALVLGVASATAPEVYMYGASW